jgi:hypothetical protein
MNKGDGRRGGDTSDRQGQDANKRDGAMRKTDGLLTIPGRCLVGCIGYHTFSLPWELFAASATTGEPASYMQNEN